MAEPTLKPKPAQQNSPAPKQEPTPSPAPETGSQGNTPDVRNQQPQEEGKREFDKTLAMSQGLNLGDEFREITGESKDRQWKPLVSEIERDSEAEAENPKGEEAPEKKQEPQPAPKADEKPEDGQQPGGESEIQAGGRKFKSMDDLVQSYGEAVREMHRTKHEGKQTTRKLELQVRALDKERQALEKLVMSGVTREAAAAARGELPNRAGNARDGATEPVSSEQMNEALTGDNPAAAVETMIESRLASIRNEQKNALDKIQKDRKASEEELLESNIRQNIQEAKTSQDMKSFSENQKNFGEWMEKVYGKDDFGLRRINEICADYGELRDKYRMFLRDTYDFTSAIQQAKAQGEASASQKERLAPIKSSPPEPTPQSPKREKPKLRPADRDYDAMEGRLGMHRRGGPLINKEGFFR